MSENETCGPTASLSRCPTVLRVAAGALILLVASFAGAETGWWNAAWTARRALTFNNSGQAENLVGFPVLVRLDASRIDYSKVQAAGQDLRFVDADNVTVLAHEIESWTPGGTSWVWVRVPQIDASSTTDFIYMYYGNPVAADGQNVPGTWDSGFTLVMHLDETAGAHQDSTTNPVANNSSAVSVAVQGSAAGQVDGADQFGGSHFVRVADHASLNMADADSFTVEAFIRTSATGWRAIVSKENAADMQYQLWLNDIGGGDSRLNFWLVGAGGVQQAQVQGTTDLSDNLFHHVVGRWDNAAGRVEIFVDGASQGSAVNAALGDLTSTNQLHIGQEGDGNGGGEWSGILDEIRISKTARSNSWIRAQNLSMRDTFISFGSEPQHRFSNVTGGCGLSAARSPLDKVSQRKVVRDKDANRYLVFGRFRDTGGCVGFQEIVLARSTDDGATWTEAVLFGLGGIAWNTGSDGFIYPALDTNAARDQLHLVVQHFSGQRLLYTRNTNLANWDQALGWTCANGGRNTGGTCSYDGAEQLNAATVYSNTAPAIAVDGDGLPHVAYESFQGSGSNRAVRWRFYRPGLGSWSPEVLVSNDVCTSGNRDVSIEASTGANGSAVVQSRVHFLYKQDADCVNTVDTLRYAYAVRSGVETYSAVTQLPGTGSGFPPFTYVWISNGTGPGRVAQGASLAAQNGRLWAVGGFDNGGASTVRMAFSSTNGDTWEVGAAAGVAVAGAAFDEGYPAVGTNVGYEHRIMSGQSLAGSSAQQGYQWLERSKAFRFRTQLQGDAAAGETGDFAHLTLEKRRPARSSDFAYCWYVSTNNGAPPPNLLLDEIRCNSEPRVMYRSIADVSPSNTYNVGTVSASNGSRIVTGAGTAWRTANRGRGDRIDIDGTNYIVDSVELENRLTLTQPYLGTTGGAKPYTLARQFTTLVNWENCIDGPTAASCPYFPVTSSSLVSDNRIEVGIGYDDGGGAFAQGATISGSTTDFVHSITLTVAPGNRHAGVAGTGVRISAAVPTPIMDITDRNVTLEWLSMASGGATANGAIRVNVSDPSLNGPVALRHNIVSGAGSHGILVGPTASQSIVLEIHNNVLRPANADAYSGIRLSPSGGAWSAGSDVYISNNTMYPTNISLINDYGIEAVPASNNEVTLVNNIAHSWDIECIQVPNPNPASNFNLVGPRPGDLDGSCTTAPGASSLLNVPLSGVGGVNFVDPGPAGNFHLLATSVAIDQATTLAGTHLADIDGGRRPNGAAWDVGADEQGATTAVRLLSLEATGADAAVDLSWRTGAEVNNLGFHVHRSLAATGPWARLTSKLIPGQGFSATGASYGWRDAGLQNGVRYYYRLEDVDAKSGSTFHGPVSAEPRAGAGGATGEGPGSAGKDAKQGGGGSRPSCPEWALAQLGSSAASYTCETFGDPHATSFEVVQQSARRALVELRTGGFVAARDASGRVRGLVPSFETLADPRGPALPLKRAVVEGVVARRGRIESAEAKDLAVFPGLVPAAVGHPQAVVGADGTVRAGRREASLRALSRGVVPRTLAELGREAFQGERKKLSLLLTPLRYDAARGGLVLARRLLVTVEFSERELRERGTGRVGRRVPRPRQELQVSAFLATSGKGLHVVAYEQLFPGQRQGIDPGTLRLSRSRGEAVVPFHVEPQGRLFGPGSRLFFYADSTASSTSFSAEVVYALESGPGGLQMTVGPGAPDGSALVSSHGRGEWETNRFLVPELLEARDLWQWEAILGGSSRTKGFTPDGLDPASGAPARLAVELQGGSDAAEAVDHHVLVSLNGTLLADDRFDGAVPHRFEAELPPSLLRADANELSVTNVGDTGVYSRVLLDRFELRYPQLGLGRAGSFQGVFAAGGTAEVLGLKAPVAVVDLTRRAWLADFAADASLRFRAEAGHEYLALSEEALLAPRVFQPEGVSRLKDARNQADWLLIGPRAFLAAAEPLVSRRQAQGLVTFQASLEEIASAFGGGEPSAEAIREFLAHAYHQWRQPSPRYVLLLGDASYDPRRFNPSAQPSPLPYLLEKTSYLWTASDPALAAVNGDDLLPDLSLGRLPATSVEQAQALVAKLLDWESQGQTLGGKAALVADNADVAGDFEANQREIAGTYLADRETRLVFLSELGSASLARTEILAALDGGLSLLSYVGHGGGAVWASENMLNSWDVPALLEQPRQPLMITMNCLNGYFIAPAYDSLAEAFLKADGRGTIAAFSPSGLSLDAPAHLYHRAVMAELVSGRHRRLGDAILSAQQAYAETGAMPELLAIYHLFADPAMTIR